MVLYLVFILMHDNYKMNMAKILAVTTLCLDDGYMKFALLSALKEQEQEQPQKQRQKQEQGLVEGMDQGQERPETQDAKTHEQRKQWAKMLGAKLRTEHAPRSRHPLDTVSSFSWFASETVTG